MASQDDQQLVFIDSPRAVRLTGVALALGSLFFFVNSKMQFTGFIFVAIGLGMLLVSSELTITADRSTRILQLSYKFFLFHQTKEIPFDDISEIKALRVSNYNKGYTNVGYRIIAVLKNGKTIPFRIYTAGEGGDIKMASQLHTFIIKK